LFIAIAIAGMVTHATAVGLWGARGAHIALVEPETGKWRHYNKVKIADTIFCGLAFIALFVVSAIRKNVGSDYLLYSNWYNKIKFLPLDLNALNDKEKGWVISSKIISNISFKTPVLMFAIFAAFILIFFFIYVIRHSSLPWLSVTAFIGLGYFLLSIHFMRQMVAAVICAFAINCIYRNQWLRFLVLVLFASCFHISAFLLIPFYFVLKIPITPIVLGAYALFTTFVFLNSTRIFAFVTTYIYTGYGGLEDNEFMYKGSTNYIHLSMFGLYVVCYMFKDNLLKRSKFNGLLMNCLFFAGFFETLGSHHALVSRLILYFVLPGVILLLPELAFAIGDYLKGFSRKREKTMTTLRYLFYVGIGAYIVASYVYLINVNYCRAVPYHTIYEGFDGINDVSREGDLY
jgi:transmembrane protein EpsG